MPNFYFRYSVAKKILKIIERDQLALTIKEGPQGQEDASRGQNLRSFKADRTGEETQSV